ncbi:MAG: hypothetical protein M3Y09_17765, partial [Actinomycetota bacterium]|nr:hypothetical protein [Actinomycetota bacterium]
MRARQVLAPLAALLAGLLATPAARGDQVIAQLTRDSPIAAYGGAVAWSAYDAHARRFQLVIDQGGQAALAPIPAALGAFDVSLGPDAAGHVVALYTRCRAAGTGCDVYRYDLRTHREAKVVAVSSPTQNEALAAQWGDQVAFVRRARAYAIRAPGSSYNLVPDPRGRRRGDQLVECDAVYVKSLSSPAPSRRLDRGECAPATGLSIRGRSIVEVTDIEAGGAGSESQVRQLSPAGGLARVIARTGG